MKPQYEQKKPMNRKSKKSKILLDIALVFLGIFTGDLLGDGSASGVWLIGYYAFWFWSMIVLTSRN
jgi:hypothetical protein